MKKYFRTKENNIYKRLFNDGAIIGANMGGSCCDKNLNPISETIIKESDNLEELCDEFVLIDEENEHYIKQDNDIHHIRRKMAIGNYQCFGAIWTDKGLIYVAKMNDKGELELL